MRNILLAGVGGQGTILAGDVIAEVGLAAGQDVKKAEVHGMAQRGGSVVTHVRWGQHVYSPLFGRGETTHLVSFEKLEALRHVDMLRADSVVLISDDRISPLSVAIGGDAYPTDERILEVIGGIARNCYLLPGMRWAQELGSARVHNMVLVGALSYFLDGIEVETWMGVIRDRVPGRYVDLNCRAFLKGREAMCELVFPNGAI